METVPAHVRLVNDIAVHFGHLPGDEAADAVARHMRTFWDPRMRAALLAHVDRGGAGLAATAVAAAALLRH